MADPRGFLKLKRKRADERLAAERVGDHREIPFAPPTDDVRAQASRCMDCGIPFCHQGCPLGNVIPEFNDLVWRGRIDDALRVLHGTNNFPEITGRVCPAPCEASCVLALEDAPVTIKEVELSLARAEFATELAPVLARRKSGSRVAIVGSGPAGMAAAQQLARAGHDVVLFERDDRAGGLLRYGIPDFKLEKDVLDRRFAQMREEGVVIETGAAVGSHDLRAFDATVLCIGARVPRDLPVPGRDLAGVHFAMDFLEAQNRSNADPSHVHPTSAAGHDVVVIGGGDTGSDCVGTANRHRARSVTQLELLPRPPLVRAPDNPWPAWPLVFRTSTSHEEGCARDFAVMTKGFVAGPDGRVGALAAVRAEIGVGTIREVPGTALSIPCTLALLAMGFTGPERRGLVDELGLAVDARGCIVTDAAGRTNVDGVFAAGDASRGQSLVVWAIADGRRVATGVDRFLHARRLGAVRSPVSA